MREFFAPEFALHVRRRVEEQVHSFLKIRVSDSRSSEGVRFAHSWSFACAPPPLVEPETCAFAGVRQVDLADAVIRLEGEQTKNADARTVPLPDRLIAMLEKRTNREGLVFSTTNLRKEWQEACAACGLGTLEDKRPRTLRGATINAILDFLHDRRSAMRNLVRAGVRSE